MTNYSAVKGGTRRRYVQAKRDDCCIHGTPGGCVGCNEWFARFLMWLILTVQEPA